MADEVGAAVRRARHVSAEVDKVRGPEADPRRLAVRAAYDAALAVLLAENVRGGRAAVVEFLRGKWNRELDYRLRKELWAFQGNRIAVRFEYEFHDASGQWWRAYGNENWEFNELGFMRRRYASINELRITEGDRKFRWARS